MILDWRQQQKLKATFFWLVDWAAKLAAAAAASSFFKQPISSGPGSQILLNYRRDGVRSATHSVAIYETEA